METITKKVAAPKARHREFEGIDSEDILVRELPTYRPLYWQELPEGPKRDALRAEQETPGYKYFAR